MNRKHYKPIKLRPGALSLKLNIQVLAYIILYIYTLRLILYVLFDASQGSDPLAACRLLWWWDCSAAKTATVQAGLDEAVESQRHCTVKRSGCGPF